MSEKIQQLRFNKERQTIINLGLLVILFFPGFLYAQNCNYDKNGFREVPWGHIRSEVDLGEIRKIRGKVFAGNEEELFGVQIVLYKIEAEKNIFIGSQISDEKGNFCFKGLKKGKYELRMGKEGFNSGIFHLLLNPKNKKLSDKIEAYLEVGT